MKNLLNSLSEERLNELVLKAEDLFRKGECCPVNCGGGDIRPCGAVKDGIKAASFAVHEGEEPPVSGWNGAGNIFFSGCSAKCVFCQNWPISHENNGKIYSVEEFGENVLKLIKKNVHNINLVTADHYLGIVLRSFAKIKENLNIPIVYNCNGAHTEELFKIILEVSDIFLFDVKYATDLPSSELSCIREYVSYNQRCLEMLLEKNIPWVENDLGILQKGLIIRHLVLPGYIDNSLQVVELLNNLKKRGLDFKLSLMSQYFPAHLAHGIEKINRRLTPEEYSKVTDLVEKYEIDGWIQEF
jgi:putative pyruvate formate lyase activating enzyme